MAYRVDKIEFEGDQVLVEVTDYGHMDGDPVRKFRGYLEEVKEDE